MRRNSLLMAEQPTGTVTLLFTDIEGSTSLLERVGTERYAEALELHRTILRAAFERHGGYEVDYEGDAFFVAFARASDAAAAASEAQRALAQAEWPEEGQIRVRMGIHTGEPLAAPPKYVGLDVHKAARVMAVGHGGQVLMSSATQRLVGDIPLRSLGAHRLKDLSQPEPLYQLAIAGLRSDFPALRTLGNRPNNLPVMVTPFIGREQELATVGELLLREQVRLLTLTGPGGIGKTRLALQAAADALEEFHDGVFWVPFAPVRDPNLAPSTVAQALGVAEERGESIGDTLGRHLAERQMLLVLDNLEHIVFAARDFVAAILATAPGIRIVTTSREALRISAEQLYDVPALSLPEDGMHTIDSPGDAVDLFVSRARAADPRFSLIDGDVNAVTEIVRRLEGLPLAIELAAARVRALPPQALVVRLEDRFRLLTRGAHDADERQRTLRATIEWSYDLLPPSEQRLLAALGVFVGGCRIEAAEAVCNARGDLGLDILDGIESLIEKSLLRQRQDPDGQPRYWMLETLREFAEGQLQDEGAHLALVKWLTGCAVAAEQNGTAEAMVELRREDANIRAVLDWCFARNEHARARALAIPLGLYWYLIGAAREGAASIERLLPYAATNAERARLLHWAGSFRAQSGDSIAFDMLSESLELSRAAGNDKGTLFALFGATTALAMVGRYEEALPYAREAVGVARRQGDTRGVAVALGNLGLLRLAGGRTAQAAAAFARAREISRAAGDSGTEAMMTAALANSAATAGRLGEARELAEESLQLASSIEGSLHQIEALTTLAAVEILAGNIDASLSALARLDEKVDGILDDDLVAQIGVAAASCATASGEEEKAALLWDAARSLAGVNFFGVAEELALKFAPADGHSSLTRSDARAAVTAALNGSLS